MIGLPNTAQESAEKPNKEDKNIFELNSFPPEQKKEFENILESFFAKSKIEKKTLTELVTSIEYSDKPEKLNEYYGQEGDIASCYDYKNEKFIIYPDFFKETSPEIVLGHEFGEVLLIKGILKKDDFSDTDLELISPEWVAKLQKPTNKPEKISQEKFDNFWEIHKNNQIIADIFAHWLISSEEESFIKNYGQGFSREYLETNKIDKQEFAKNLHKAWSVFNNNQKQVEQDIKTNKNTLLEDIFYGIEDIEPIITEPTNMRNKSGGTQAFVEEIWENVKKLGEILNEF